MPKSKPERKGSRQAAAKTASEAFAARPASTQTTLATSSPSQDGKRRLRGAFYIRLDRVEPDPDQPRKNVDSQKIIELASSIKELGILQPLSVRYVADKDVYRIIAGESRYQAAKQIGLKELPCWERTPEKNEILAQQVAENWVRSDLSPFDLAEALGILRDANGYTQVQLAAVTGKSQGEISKTLGILDLDPEVQAIARNDSTGLVSRRHLLAIRDFPVARQIKLLSGVQDGRYTAEALELLYANATKNRSETGRRHNFQRRTFKTRHATVRFEFRKPDVNGHDIIEALREIKRQVAEEGIN